jgi:hypothetical protein
VLQLVGVVYSRFQTAGRTVAQFFPEPAKGRDKGQAAGVWGIGCGCGGPGQCGYDLAGAVRRRVRFTITIVTIQYRTGTVPPCLSSC